MNDRKQTTDLVASSNYSSQIKKFEDELLGFIEQYGLPTDQVLVQVSERLRVFSNVEGVVERIELEQRQRSIYISKFIAAAAAGLFDTSLKYLWDETIYELRRLCRKKFRELMEIMKDKVSMPAVKELIDDVEKYRGPLDKLKDNSKIKRKVKALRKIIAL